MKLNKENLIDFLDDIRAYVFFILILSFYPIIKFIIRIDERQYLKEYIDYYEECETE